MFNHLFNLVMDPKQNPLKSLPKVVCFQMMTILSYMWSAVFTIWIGSYMALWPTILGHTALIVAIFFTADVFRRAGFLKVKST